MRDYIEQVLTNSLNPSFTELTVAVVFTSFYSPSDITQSHIDVVLDRWNIEFASIETSFIQCGAIKYFEAGFTGSVGVSQLTPYSYSGNVLNVYIGPFGSMGTLPNISGSSQDNIITFSYGDINTPSDQSIIHEMGHSFGLLHTHHEDGASDDPNDTSGPEPPKELVIRAYTPGKTYPNPNCEWAADLVCDTQANVDCGQPTESCTFTQTNACDHMTDYTDPNGDPIMPDINNYMSSFLGCRTTFTEGQRERMRSFKDYRAAQYTNYESYCAGIPDFTDFVEFEDTNEGLSNVSVDLNVQDVIHVTGLTDGVGQFGLYGEGTVFMGIIIRQGNGGNGSYDYTYADWMDGVSSWDLGLIQKHILGIDLLNGYQQIAADVNGSAESFLDGTSISQFDIVFLRQLILGQIDNLPILSPWVFIPEYIPQDFAQSFHSNPFNIPEFDISVNGGPGDPFHYPKYTGFAWQYPISNNGKAGFDAVKIGDVNGTNSEAGLLLNTETCKEVLLSNTQVLLLKKGETLEVEVMADNFENIAAWQIGASFKTGLKVIEVTAGSLPDFDDNSFYKPEEEDVVRSLWFTQTGEALSVGRANLFTVTLEVTQAMETTIGDLMLLDEEVLSSRFYKADGCIDYVDVYIEVTSNSNEITERSSQKIQTTRLQVIPNPVKKEMQLLLDLPMSSEGVIQIQDAFGKVFLQKNEYFVKGNNGIKIPVNPEWPNGLLFVTVQTKDASFTEKIVKLE